MPRPAEDVMSTCRSHGVFVMRLLTRNRYEGVPYVYEGVPYVCAATHVASSILVRP